MYPPLDHPTPPVDEHDAPVAAPRSLVPAALGVVALVGFACGAWLVGAAGGAADTPTTPDEAAITETPVDGSGCVTATAPWRADVLHADAPAQRLTYLEQRTIAACDGSTGSVVGLESACWAPYADLERASLEEWAIADARVERCFVAASGVVDGPPARPTVDDRI
jgi:hypothetical protein